ncbi:MAG: 5'/3'-nucleotidase SurE [Saccharofermentans sp.]|nr:5'/3'-nucleotidase SurE [Saccharofermentans sp.]
MNKPKILITNDDGISSPGLIKLAKVAMDFGDVWVVAPDSQRSGVSHSFSYSRSLRVAEYDIGLDVPAFECSGMPADCVRAGIIKILPKKPDFVFAGINNGPNISKDIQYSGTLGAAFEAATFGIHAIAFSQFSPLKSEVTDRYLSLLMAKYMDKPLERDCVWNINFPGCSLSECNGILEDRIVSQDDFYNDDYDIKELEPGVKEFSLIFGRNWNATSGTDLEAIANNCVSIGPVYNIK